MRDGNRLEDRPVLSNDVLLFVFSYVDNPEQGDFEVFHGWCRDWGFEPHQRRAKRKEDSVTVTSSRMEKVLTARAWSEKEAASPPDCCVLEEQMMFSSSKPKYACSWPFFCLGLVACSQYAEISYQFQREQGTLPLLNISFSIDIYSWLVWTNAALSILDHDCKEEWYRTDHLKSRTYSSPCPLVWQCDCIPGFWADLVYLHNTFLCTVTH